MQSHPAPDLIVTARRIHVLGDHPPVQALLVRGGRIAALGTADEVRHAALPGARTEHVDGVITPGLTDAHVHLTLWALARRRVDLNAAATLDAGLAVLAEAAKSGEGWVRGLGWDQHRWGGFPTKEALDRACPDRPAFLQSHDLHGAWVNSEALRRCGITRDTPDPEGGEIVRDAAGEPTGVLLEKAIGLVESRLPQESPEEVRDALLDAQAEAHRLGLTGVHSVEVTGLEDFTAMELDGVLRLRVLQAIPLPRLDHAIGARLRSGFGGPWLRIGGVKMFLDGALGSRTALMRQPYEGGGVDDRGIRTLEPDVFRENVRRAAEAGIASTVHAIGDAAVELAIDVLGSAPRVAAMPHRIEHVQLCPPDLWERAGRSGLVGSMQPVHLVTDIPAAERHWSHARSRGAYAFAPLANAGMTLAFGSDVPVETCDPRMGLFAAVRRVGWSGEPREGWWMENAIPAGQALRAYTEGPAHAAGLSHRQGRLLPGYDADLVAWDVDPLDCEVDALREMRCVMTMVDGEVVQRDGERQGLGNRE
ncbi:amidohydrolase [Longimicrobium sp.]|uniref:amidohydrolase n=1 Tax=Longimicrobium sp. TaxID=2029185 RepID=UPI002E345596|nr:amidohydrolase [Longimicrobium sp.]HEX6041954.1 amidohydrolase [Longimicrobium sp.]